jgi:hypothetical protein
MQAPQHHSTVPKRGSNRALPPSIPITRLALHRSLPLPLPPVTRIHPRQHHRHAAAAAAAEEEEEEEEEAAAVAGGECVWRASAGMRQRQRLLRWYQSCDVPGCVSDDDGWLLTEQAWREAPVKRKRAFQPM